jgi:hypothetical protein
VRESTSAVYYKRSLKVTMIDVMEAFKIRYCMAPTSCSLTLGSGLLKGPRPVAPLIFNPPPRKSEKYRKFARKFKKISKTRHKTQVREPMKATTQRKLFTSSDSRPYERIRSIAVFAACFDFADCNHFHRTEYRSISFSNSKSIIT